MAFMYGDYFMRPAAGSRPGRNRLSEAEFLRERLFSWGKKQFVDTLCSVSDSCTDPSQTPKAPVSVGRAIVCELVEEKTAKVKAALPDGGEGRPIFHAFFSRAGFTVAAAIPLYTAVAHAVKISMIIQDKIVWLTQKEKEYR